MTMGRHRGEEDLGPPRTCHRREWRLTKRVYITVQNSNKLTLDSGTIGNGLIGVDGLVELLAVEVILEELLDLGDTGGAADQNDLVDAFKVG